LIFRRFPLIFAANAGRAPLAIVDTIVMSDRIECARCRVQFYPSFQDPAASHSFCNG